MSSAPTPEELQADERWAALPRRTRRELERKLRRRFHRAAERKVRRGRWKLRYADPKSRAPE